jgi:hypothetical protein
MTSIEGFEGSLVGIFQEENPTVLDDEFNDSFWDWVANQDYQGIGEMAQTYCYRMGLHKNWQDIRDQFWVKNFGPLPTEYQAHLQSLEESLLDKE